MNILLAAAALLLASLPTILSPGLTRNGRETVLHLGWADVARQTRHNTCGPALVATLTLRAGSPVSEQSVALQAALREDGVTLAELARLLHVAGLDGSWFRPARQQLQQLGAFVAHTNQDGGHFVLVEEVHSDYIRLTDPARGQRIVPRRNWLSSWSGHAFLFGVSSN